eukprot:986470-Ditylum_brightwellii.AAC.1
MTQPTPPMITSPIEEDYDILQPLLLQSPAPVINNAIDEINRFDPLGIIINTSVRLQGRNNAPSE